MSDTGSLATISANPPRRLEVRTVLAVLLAWFGAAGLIVEGRTQNLESDKQALIALYNATDGPNWNVNHGWLSDEPLDTWFGVIVSEGRVRQLVLNANQLTGSIPAELGNLTHLALVTLAENQLTGPVPSELGNLTDLILLDLRNNQLTGGIPAELGSLFNLTSLVLSENRRWDFESGSYKGGLEGSIPAELGNLAALESLDLYNNQLTGAIPAELGDLANLTYLSLGFNQLTGSIPATLAGLASLESLNLLDNRLSGAIPAELGSLANLESLSLARNQLTGPIPAALGNLANLYHLHLSGNQLTGTIPAELGSLANLWSLDLYTNQLTGPIPAALGRLANLGRLHLGNNQLTGPIPATLGDLANLRRLYLSGNQLTGSIPSQLGNLADLEQLSLSHNRLTGPIPAALGNLSNLVALSLLNNQLTGPIPAELGALANLGSLHLANNRLTGPMPAELGALPDLWQLNLSGNRLTGPIPSELGALANLERLFLADNRLTGPIPPELGNLSSLTRLSLANNLLMGPIPEEIGNLSSLRRLDLSGNQLTGTIPQSLTNLRLGHFYFHGNPGLTVPEDMAFEEWLGGIPELRNQAYSPLTLFVPAILNSAGRNNAFFTSEMTLTNRGAVPAYLTYSYTAHIGGGSGIADDTLRPGGQRVIPDVIDYLRTRGVPIPGTGNRIGTLRVSLRGFSSSAVAVVVRTTTRVPDGRAGLAYPAVSVEDGFNEAVYLCGLRQNAHDRSNVAFQNLGTAADGPITLRTTVFSGEAEDGRPRLLEDRTLQPGGFYQYSGLLELLDGVGGHGQGYVKVDRVGGTAPFYAYGVINDQVNSDGSFVFPVTASSLMGTRGQTLPVIVETGVLTSELMVTNFSDVAKTLIFRFRAEAIQTPDKTATVKWTFHPGQQVMVPNIVDMMRKMGTPGIGPSGQTFAGALFATVTEGDMSGIAIGARTSSPGGGGQYGVFYNAVPYGEAFGDSAWVDGLQQNDENRSNLALVNTGEVDGSASVFQLDVYDGATGMLANTVTGLTVAAGGWYQIDSILAGYAPETTQGYVRVTKISGNNPFLAYGAINDGGIRGQRSGDGAYVPARE